MSQLGNLANNLGNPIYIYNSDLSIKELRTYNKAPLPKNAIIISSPTNNKGEDKNTPALVVTDYNGTTVPLTYTPFKEHFSINESNNTIELNMTYLVSYFYSYFVNIFTKKK